ncbi:MAG: sodium:proton antiporter NhaD [Bacteroidia bacterium]|jgi:Na+/H+ antiporter NhaD/arsenite permease-like protein
MDALLLITFVLGYLAIVFEHPLKINKTAPALLTAVICWSIFILLPPSADFYSNVHWTQFIDGLKLKQIDLSVFSTEQLFQKFVSAELAHHLSKTSEILFFLLGAMTIVELVDAHQGFKVITNRIRTKNASTLLIIICIVSFFLSAVLDNLTTSIVMISLLRKLVHDSQQRKLFAGMVIIAANAGGAWSPIGDVTTTMLWIGGQITAGHIIQSTFIASVVCLAVPLAVMATQLKGTVTRAAYDYDAADEAEVVKGSRIMLFLGVGALIFVPIFKSVTHLPPYLGILLGLAVLWVASEWIHIDKDEEEKKPYSAIHALSKIDTSSVLFFLGILLAISALESAHILTHVAQWLDSTLGNMKLIVFIIGLLSAVVDNVPLVAASMGMYDMSVYPTDHWMWAFMAYCAGTGGSALIIGSAAGVAVMGMEKIDFMWYAKKISLYALMGYFAGAGVYLLTYQWFG